MRLPVSHAGASETFIPEGALLPGLVGPEREVEQEADRDHHGDHADHIPGPGSNDQRVRYVRRFAEENIVGSKGPVEQAYAQQQRLSNEGDLPPGAGAGSHADNKCQGTGGRENSSMPDVVIEEDERKVLFISSYIHCTKNGISMNIPNIIRSTPVAKKTVLLLFILKWEVI